MRREEGGREEEEEEDGKNGSGSGSGSGKSEGQKQRVMECVGAKEEEDVVHYCPELKINTATIAIYFTF